MDCLYIILISARLSSTGCIEGTMAYVANYILVQMKYVPVVVNGQLQLKQPIESIPTQLISQLLTSKGGHPPDPLDIPDLK